MSINPDGMVSVNIEDFFVGQKMPFDVFVRLSESKFICVAREGSETDRKSLTSFKDKAIELLWVNKSDLRKLSDITISIAGMAVSKNELALGQKTQIVSSAAKSVFEEISQLGINTDMMTHAKKVTDLSIKLVESQDDFVKLVHGLNHCSDELLRHSLAVSSFSVMIAKAMNWTKQVSYEKLALGGMLHDIGKKCISPHLSKKPKNEMSYEEIKEYELHPFKGMEMLKPIHEIHPDVVAMVYEHHENSIKQGFPRRLRDHQINPFARIVALANEFANLTVSNPNYPSPRSAKQAIEYIAGPMGQPFNDEVFKAFRLALNPQRKNKKNSSAA